MSLDYISGPTIPAFFPTLNAPLNKSLPGIWRSPIISELGYIEPMVDSIPNESVVLPSTELVERMELQIPQPYSQLVWFIHEGIVPTIENGYLTSVERGIDIHHIIRRSVVKKDRVTSVNKFPFNGTIRPLIEDLVSSKTPLHSILGCHGHMLINLIPLDFNFHHNYVEKSSQTDPIIIGILGTHRHISATLPEILMAFNIFNIYLRRVATRRFIEEKILDIEDSLEQKIMLRQRKLLKEQLDIWVQLAMEFDDILEVANEIKDENPLLYAAWQNAISSEA